MCGNWIATAYRSLNLFTGGFSHNSPRCLLFPIISFLVQFMDLGKKCSQSDFYKFNQHINKYFCLCMQYIPHMMKGDRHVFDRFAVIFSVVIVWVYAHILTVAGTYKNSPIKTQLSCRTDRAGIISGSPW